MKVRLMIGAAQECLHWLEDESVHCCITSPPYWGRRKYNGEPGMVGMEKTFEEHLDNLVVIFREVRRILRPDGTLWLNYGDGHTSGDRGTYRSGTSKNLGHDVQNDQERPRTPIGLKPKDLLFMPERVAMALQEDGWYVRSSIVWHKPNPMPESATDRPSKSHEKIFLCTKNAESPLFWTHREFDWAPREKPDPDYIWRNLETLEETADEPDGWEDLVDEDGDRIWVRRNLWTGHSYFYDHVAVRTASKNPEQYEKPYKPQGGKDADGTGAQAPSKTKKRIVANKRAEMQVADKQRGHGRRHAGFNKRWKAEQAAGQSIRPDKNDKWGGPRQGLDKNGWDDLTRAEGMAGGANLKDVWTVATHSYPGAHFATYPPELIKPCIMAGTSAKGVCPDCGNPWVRQSVHKTQFESGSGKSGNAIHGKNSENTEFSQDKSGNYDIRKGPVKSVETVGWVPTCDCRNPDDEHWDPVPATVLDPFAGSGTTGFVACAHNRDSILIEISPEYAELIEGRTKAEFGMLCELETENWED